MEDTEGLKFLLARMGVTPERFQYFATENRKAGAKYRTQLISFEDAVVDLDLDQSRLSGTDFGPRAEFIVALQNVLESYRSWRLEGGYGRHIN